MTRARRIEQVVMGVVAQTMRDARQTCCSVIGQGADAELVRTWCRRAYGEMAAAGGLVLAATNKTALLLGAAPQADLLPLGDLYYSQVLELCGSAELAEPSAELAAACGGAAAVDRALETFFDQRQSWPAATAHLSAGARAQLHSALEAARFRRARVPLVPKLSACTLGIDLYA